MAEKPPEPVTVAVHGVLAIPSKSTAAGQDTVVVVAVFVGTVTFSVNLAGLKLKLPPVLFDTWVRSPSTAPAVTPVKTTGTSTSHAVNVTVEVAGVTEPVPVMVR